MYILGFTNPNNQTVDPDGIINLGTVYRKYARKNSCGNCAFSLDSNSLGLLQQGIYELIVSFTVSAPVAGDVTIQLYQNGTAVPGATATETITTAETEIRTMTIPYMFLVNNSNILCNNVTSPVQVSAINTSGIEITVNNVSATVKKVVY